MGSIGRWVGSAVSNFMALNWRIRKIPASRFKQLAQVIMDLFYERTGPLSGREETGSQNKLYLKINILNVYPCQDMVKIESHLELGG
jgi:hypothetical protein